MHLRVGQGDKVQCASGSWLTCSVRVGQRKAFLPVLFDLEPYQAVLSHPADFVAQREDIEQVVPKYVHCTMHESLLISVQQSINECVEEPSDITQRLNLSVLVSQCLSLSLVWLWIGQLVSRVSHPPVLRATAIYF